MLPPITYEPFRTENLAKGKDRLVKLRQQCCLLVIFRWRKRPGEESLLRCGCGVLRASGIETSCKGISNSSCCQFEVPLLWKIFRPRPRPRPSPLVPVMFVVVPEFELRLADIAHEFAVARLAVPSSAIKTSQVDKHRGAEGLFDASRITGEVVLFEGSARMDDLERVTLTYDKSIGCQALSSGTSLLCFGCDELHQTSNS